jgi:hypothetical protein
MFAGRVGRLDVRYAPYGALLDVNGSIFTSTYTFVNDWIVLDIDMDTRGLGLGFGCEFCWISGH